MDATVTAAAIGVGGSVIVALAAFWANVRNTNKTTELTHRALQLTERGQVTDQYSRAVGQLGSDKAPIRLGALYALERFAQDNLAHRQSTVNVICAYLRMPFPLTPPASEPVPEPGEGAREPVPGAEVAALADNGDDWQQEKQVRLTAQRVLGEHLRRIPPDAQPSADPAVDLFWPGIRLDLTGATLIDFSCDGAELADAQFRGATFHSDARFGGAAFNGRAEFGAATFHGKARFEKATFHGDAEFGGTIFNSTARFGGATFHGGTVRFGGATFHGTARLEKATFHGNTWFSNATFNGNTWFSNAAFKGNTSFDSAHFDGGTGWFDGATFSGGARFSEATFKGIARFGKATFHGDARFGGATFHGDAEFGGAAFHGDARFGGATFSGGARFSEATFKGTALFDNAIFNGMKETTSFANSRVLTPDAAHIWPKGWCIGETSNGGHTVVRADRSASS